MPHAVTQEVESVMVATRGPVPKRSDQRRRRNADDLPISHAPAASRVPVPAADRGWHPIAKRWYRSLRGSGQSAFYEPSDWAVAFLVAESMSRDLGEQFLGINEKTGEVEYGVIPLKGASLAAYLKAFASLMVTEGDRRRMRLELERGTGEVDPDEAAGVASMDEWRERLSGGSDGSAPDDDGG